MKRLSVSFILACITAVTIYAQETVVQNKELDSFTTVSIGDKFAFRLKAAPSHSVRILSDERIADYIRPVVKNGSFMISIDEKSYPAELKKALKAKGAAEPFVEIEIYAPNVKSLEVKGKAVLLEADDIRVDNFTLKTAGSSKVNNLKIECVNADFAFGGSSQANISVTADTKTTISTENSSVSSILQTGGNTVIKSKGSSTVNLKAEVVGVEIESSGGSSIYLSGIASMLDVKSSGGSMLDAEAMEVKEGNFVQSGLSKCHVNVEDRMRVNLTGGCMLTFKRKPSIEVDRIVNSTLIKADDPKRK